MKICKKHQMNCCVVALIVLSSDILAGSADSLY